MFAYFGVLMNTLTVIVGSLLGLLIRKYSNKTVLADGEESLSSKLMVCLGFCTVFASAGGLVSLETKTDALICVVSMVAGVLIGIFFKLDDRLNSLGNIIISKLPTKHDTKENPAVGFVTACLIFCIGSMTVLGSFESASNTQNYLVLSCHITLLIKSLLDLVSSTCLSTKYGFSVMLSAIFVLIFQGLLVFLASIIRPFLEVSGALGPMNTVGSIILLIIACNLTGIKKIKTGDYIPAIFMPILICSIINLIG